MDSGSRSLHSLDRNDGGGIDPTLARRATDAVPSVPRDAEGPVFREPWEAQAFAMALGLHARGLFTWPEWAAMLAEEIKRAQAAGDPDTGETYYRHWLNTLERMVGAKGGCRRILAAATASCTARFTPTPPIGDIDARHRRCTTAPDGASARAGQP